MAELRLPPNLSSEAGLRSRSGNLPRWFSLWAGGDWEFVRDLGVDWSDTSILKHAAANGLAIVSKDADFSDRVLLTDEGPSVIRVGNLTMAELHRYLTSVWVTTHPCAAA